MAKGKKTGGRDFGPGNRGNVNGRPKLPVELKAARQLNKIDFALTLNRLIHSDKFEIERIADDKTVSIFESISAKLLKTCHDNSRADIFELFTNILIGNVRNGITEHAAIDITPEPRTLPQKKTFTEFCLESGYPAPYPKQLEMVDFGLTLTEPRLLLGSRGYGKTDYVTIMGLAYELYMKGPEVSWMILTKEKKRASAIIEEIAEALRKNKVDLEKSNSNCIRVSGRVGKDHSIDARSIRSGLRGPHPYGIVMDDPVTEEDVSEATRMLVERKYNEAYKLTPNILIIGQPAHAHDLYAKLRPLLKVMEVPHGTIPELDHDLDAMRLAGVDQRSIEMSYHLRIPKDGNNPFDNIKYLDRFPTGDSAVAFIDPSHEGGDYTALSIVKAHFEGVAVEGRVWKKAWNHSLDEMVPHLKALNVKKLAFETNALGDQPIIMLRDLLTPLGIGVVGRRSNNNKHSRIMAAGAFAHLIHLSKQSDKVYTDQVVQYEYNAKHDDAPDSLATCLEWIGLLRGKT